MVMIANLITTGILTTQTWPYYTAIGLTAIHISNQVNVINYLNNFKKFTEYISIKLFPSRYIL